MRKNQPENSVPTTGSEAQDTSVQEGAIVEEGVLDVEHPVEAGLALASNSAKDLRESRDIDAIVSDFSTNKDRLAAAGRTMEQALVVASIAQVWMARDAYMAATSPEVLASTPGQKINNKGAAARLGMSTSTMRQHVLAGKALAEAGRADITSPPKQKDVDIVMASREANMNAPKRESNAAIKARNAASLAAAGAIGAIAPPAPPAGNGGTTGGTTPPAPAMTAKSVLARAEALVNMCDTFVKNGGLFTKEELTKLEGLLTEAANKTGAKIPAAKVPAEA